MTEQEILAFPATVPQSDSSSTASSHVEKATVEPSAIVKSDLAELELPAKHGRSSLTRWLYHIAFSYYRKIFTVIFAANLTAFIVIVVKNDGHPLAPNMGTAASVNLMATLLFRQENFVNLLYEIAVACPHGAPLWLRRRLAKVFHYGGGHSGSGVAAVVWYIMYTAVLTRDFIADRSSKWAVANLATSYILVTMFCFILTAAHPVLRRRYHDYFEAGHRYSGWIALATFWMHSIFAANQYRVLEPGPPSLGRYLINTASFWTFCISTGCSLLSWSRLRRHDVYPEVLSSHAIRLHFKYRDMQPFYGLKVSTRPLLEWHAFATIPDDDGSGSGPKGFSIVVSHAGDWTRECIINPPTKLWIRGAPMHGLLYTSKLFKKIVVVATGSGIGPCLSLFYADVTPRRIFWSTPSPAVTYGKKIVDMVRKADPDAWIWDTRTDGRPDMVAVTYKLVVESNAEAVFIISNPKLTRRVVYGMESRGIAAYGAIFDS
ncbi:hypothetical protein FB45DRAFT_1027139 [Roridomyces roridus]|uniref:Nonribosomal peptide synthetase 12 n=1 Tax=Roridomyces roridus TaxID=1738132 RepID=A0AAD7BXI8_9AGAR|nr:hypothetical protein FB45DRAFT_1027139 [Roridomyces roridus]